ncbi:MAG: hypothetical protein JJU28_00765 [Cyclobacteriaceae bacterium]|nr:hypothetical protein [Cyclobacteriaceae bacterium]
MYRISFFLALILLLNQYATAQTGSIHEPVRYVGGESVDPHVHEGRLRLAVGVESRQTLRVNRTKPELAEDYGWTYNHASNLCYWNGRFYQQYLSNPVDEHIAPGHTLITHSADGRKWSKPEVVFPAYEAPAGVQIPEGYDGYMMHQRMGFYVAPNGRLLTLAFYGHTEDPFKEGGIGRVVREVYKDGSYGPIYFIRYSSHTDWNESNTSFPFYKKSTDRGFLDACESLLADKLKTMQWWDEDNGLDGFYEFEKAGSALSYYRRKDGKVVLLWKRSNVALSEDNGKTFSPIVKVPTLTMAGGKMWGQQTKDGRYAISYNPIDMDEYRYPLIAISGDDGIIFDNMLIIQGEVPARRFFGRWKDFGPCYTRGIIEGNGNPPGNDMWLTYSMNKEDMWVSRVPLPISYAVNGPVNDNFDQLEISGPVPMWNIYAPLWSPVEVVNSPEGKGKSLELKDKDPYDYARAIRIFEEGQEVSLSLKVRSGQNDHGRLEFDVADRYGNRPVRIHFEEGGVLVAYDGHDRKIIGNYQSNRWYTIELKIQATLSGKYSMSLDGKEVLKNAQLTEAVKSVERLSIRTGEYRNLPGRRTPNEDPEPPLPGADDPVKEAVFWVDDVRIQKY